MEAGIVFPLFSSRIEITVGSASCTHIRKLSNAVKVSLDMLLGVRYGPGHPYSSPSHATAHEANLAFMASGGV